MYQTWNCITWICSSSSSWLIGLANAIYHSYGRLCAEKFLPWLGIAYSNSWCMCCSRGGWVRLSSPCSWWNLQRMSVPTAYKHGACLADLHLSFFMTHTPPFPGPIGVQYVLDLCSSPCSMTAKRPWHCFCEICLNYRILNLIIQ